jgi:sugar lactone lactonase YvrE
LVTALAAIVYVQEPNLPGADKTINSGHVVDPDHRIVAIDGQGRIAQIDSRTGDIGAMLPHKIDVSHPDAVTVSRLENGQSAYVGYVADGDDEVIELVHLDTGDATKVGTGRSPALAPDENVLAYVRAVAGHLHLIVQDTVTGHETDLGVAPTPALAAVESMAWTGDGQQLIVLSSVDGSLWSVDRNARSFSQAKPLTVDTGQSSSLDALTTYADGFAIAARRSAGSTDVVEVSSSIAAGGTRLLATVAGRVTSLDSDRADRLLVAATVGDASTLYHSDSPGEISRLSDNVIAASW